MSRRIVRVMERRMEKRIVRGNREESRMGRKEPRTCTWRVPLRKTQLVHRDSNGKQDGPLRVSSKHRFGSCRDVNITTSCPRRCRDTAASTTSRSAPPEQSQLDIHFSGEVDELNLNWFEG